MVQAERMNRRHRTDTAIAHALARRWDLAAQENRTLLEEDPKDVEAANRLGKALTELGDTPGAIEAYELALKIDSTNAIARKNLQRLEEQKKTKRAPRANTRAKAGSGAAAATSTPRRRVDVATESLRTAPLIEDFGKAADLRLQRVNARAATLVSTGDPAELEITSSGVAVKAAGGTILGHIDPRTGLRLKRMMETGNRYSVVILRSEEGQVDVHVRETLKHPSLVGQASFLPQAGDKRRTPRAYTKSSVVQYDRADDEEDYETDDDEEDVWRPRGVASFDNPTDEDEDDDDDFTEEEAEPDQDPEPAFEEDDAEIGEDDEDEEPLEDDEDD